MTFQLSDYHLAAELHRDDRVVVYRAMPIREKLGQNAHSVMIELLVAPSHQDSLNFHNQFVIANNLDLPGVVRPYQLEKYAQGYALVMEDFGGVFLDRYHQQQPLTLVEILDIAMQIADILRDLGQQQIVHKDIQPANLLIHPSTKQVKLTNFSIASLFPPETPELLSSNLLEGTLAYIAPEQTGKMNRGVDYRSDFYALGVTLYELLTGELPFIATEPIDIIHCHLTQFATPVNLVNPAIPSVVAQIVAKLMAKNSEDRYQSAIGIKYDLEKCLNQWQSQGEIDQFSLAQRDISNRFIISEKLYGRETEIKRLVAAFDLMAAPSGQPELFLVGGCSGIGKTAIINEIQKPVTYQRGYFAKGKFDQFNSSIPLSAFVQALRDLIGQLLSESDTQLAKWRSQILVAVGENVQVLIEVIPDLAKIIGEQPTLAELSGTEAQNRFNWVFQKFVGVFTTVEHPLVIFLDDLHWADVTSLELMKFLLNGKGHLLLLGVYRDNEVSTEHPLMLMVESLRQTKKNVQNFTLELLDHSNINQLIADTLHCSLEQAQPLTRIVDLKTQGNPLFIKLFLRVLQATGEIKFNNQGYWEYNILNLQQISLIDDVVEFIAAKLRELPLETQETLKTAACLGNQFELNTLAIASEKSQIATANSLWPLLETGLMLPNQQSPRFFQPEVNQQVTFQIDLNLTYRFLHDRVQQAAYSLIPVVLQEQTHLQIGRLLLAKTSTQDQKDKIFEIVHHFNKARNLISAQNERVLLAELNLDAAHKAKMSTAYTAACNYAHIGIELLGVSAWQQQYQITLELHQAFADAALLRGDFDRLPTLVQTIIDHAHNTLDRIKAYEIIIQSCALQKQYQQAINHSLEILRELRVNLHPQPNQIHIFKELIKTKNLLRGKSNQQLLDLPVMSNPHKVAILKILNLLQFSAFICQSKLVVVVSLVALQLTLRYGNTPWASVFYANYTSILTHEGELKQSYRFGQLALALLDRFPNLFIAARVKVIVPWYSQAWQEPLTAMIPLIDESVYSARESGNLLFLGTNAGMSVAARFYASLPLNEVMGKMQELEELIIQSQDENSQQFIAIFRQTIINLQEKSSHPAEILTNDYKSLISQWQEHNEFLILSVMYSFKSFLAYLFEDIPTALLNTNQHSTYAMAECGSYRVTLFCLYDSLIRLAAYSEGNDRTKAKLIKQVIKNQHQLLKFAQSMPDNFQHKYDLVEAEKCRVLGDFVGAIELYDRAIDGAKANKYVQDEALANELAAKFYLAWHKPKIAISYMEEAYSCYTQWGATAKSNDLLQRYPQLLTSIPLQHEPVVSNPPPIDLPVSQNEFNTFDLVAAIQSAQSLSSIVELPDLISQLCQILLKNSGATICIPILLDRSQTGMNSLSESEKSWQVYNIDSTYLLDNAENKVKLTSIPLADFHHLPLKLINQVRNRRETIILNRLSFGDAAQSTMNDLVLTGDDYLQTYQPQSVLCLPLLNRGELRGIVYLENRHTADIFTPDRQVMLEFLASQAVNSLQNAQLNESYVLRSAAIEASLDGIAIVENDRFVYVNHSQAKMFGYTVSELQNKSWHCLHPQEQVKYIQTTVFPILVKSKQWRGEVTAIRKDGSTFDEEITLSLLENGQVVCVSRNISKRKAMELALRKSEENYVRMFANIPAALYQFQLSDNSPGKMNYISARFSEMFEIPLTTSLDDISILFSRVHPEDWESFYQSFQQATNHQQAWVWEGRLLTPSGVIKWIQGECRPINNLDGVLVWDGVLIDVTKQQIALQERKQAELALYQSEERYQKLSENIPGVIYQFRLAADGSISYPYVSSGCWDMFELFPAKIMADSKCAIEIIHPDDLANFEQVTAESAKNMTPKLWEGRAVLRSGEIKWIKSVSRPEKQTDGSIVWDGMMLDITKLKTALHDRQQAQQDLHLTNERLELTIQELRSATHLKDEFLATMSHELRTPLNAILGMSEALQEEVFGSLNAEQINSIATIEKSGDHLLALIDDVLDVSKISVGKLELNVTKIALVDLCESSLIFVNQQAIAKQIRIDIDLPTDITYLWIDERRMRQVLINLLNNAIKFTPNGGKVILSVRLAPSQNSPQSMGSSFCFSVIDTGIGIAQADLSKLFQPFIQLDSNLNRKYNGTGLGLVIVKQIAELHNGYVSIDSEVGKGSCFSVTIPQNHLKPEEVPITKKTNDLTIDLATFPVPEAPLILLAEDNEVNINTFSSYLTTKGYRILLAQNGQEAITLSQRYQPDLILMDIHMPDMNGIEAIKYICQQSKPAKIPIIALTAQAFVGDREQCLAAGANQYLTKPVKLRELHHTIQQYLDLN
jgi:PAS domain S-box-containing protein